MYFKPADNSEKEFECLIKDVQKDRLSLKFPEEILDYSDYLEEGCELFVKIFTPSGVKTFDTIILNSPLEPEFVIEYVEDHIEIQRREYMRMELQTKIILTKKNEIPDAALTIDISGGGVKFLSDKKYEKNEEYEFMLYLPTQIHSIRAKGYILENSHIPENQHILLFTEINESDRDKIIKACFDLQLGQYSEIKESKVL